MKKIDIMKNEFSFLSKEFGYILFTENSTYNNGCYTIWKKDNKNIEIRYNNKKDNSIVICTYCIEPDESKYFKFTNMMEYSDEFNQNSRKYSDKIHVASSWLNEKMKNSNY